MGVSMEKLQRDAPHLVTLVKTTQEVSLAKGIDPRTAKAAVMGTFDLSGSNEMGSNRNYSGGTMSTIGDLVLACGFAFDDDGEIPFSYFHDYAIDLGNIIPETATGFVERTWRRHGQGGTAYLKALDWIVKQADLEHVNLTGRLDKRLRVRHKADYPTFAIFVSDGEPMDYGANPREQRRAREEIKARLRLISQLPIFIQFVGVGNHNFEFLEELNDLDGTLLDSVGFFNSADVFRRARNPQEQQRFMLEELLSEFAGSYYRKARQIGLIR